MPGAEPKRGGDEDVGIGGKGMEGGGPRGFDRAGDTGVDGTFTGGGGPDGSGGIHNETSDEGRVTCGWRYA